MEKKLKKIWYKKLPKSRGRNFCDDLWANLVKTRDGHKCMVCGSEFMINAHHLISRRVFKYRWLVPNGVSVCPTEHEFSLTLSFHTSPWAAEKWMSENRPEQYKLWVENRNNISEEFETDYDEIYYRLEQEFKAMTGNYFRIERISSYVVYKNYEKIVSLNLEGKKADEIATTLSINLKSLKEFMAKNKMK